MTIRAPTIEKTFKWNARDLPLYTVEVPSLVESIFLHEQKAVINREEMLLDDLKTFLVSTQQFSLSQEKYWNVSPRQKCLIDVKRTSRIIRVSWCCPYISITYVLSWRSEHKLMLQKPLFLRKTKHFFYFPNTRGAKLICSSIVTHKNLGTTL